MNIKTISVAQEAAKQFLESAEVVMAEMSQRNIEYNYISGTKASGDLRRKSMTLTRSLADMRRP
jgi:hypothetical protein